MGGYTDTIGPAVAGSWYPADPAALGRQVDELLAGACEPEKTPPPVPRALIEPHAGFMYSGSVAASGFRLLKGQRHDRVVVIGPSHHRGFPGAAVPAAGAYRTPLGDVPIDRAAIDELADKPGFRIDDAPFVPEHSVESEIPFLQRVLEPGWKIVPVLVGGGCSPADSRPVAEGLRALLEGGAPVVVSSDFTHYGRNFGYVPFTDDVPSRIRELDMGAVRLIEAGDADGFQRYVDETGATICGRGPIGVLLRMLPEGARGTLVAYDTSGAMTGDWSHTVSYATLAF